MIHLNTKLTLKNSPIKFIIVIQLLVVNKSSIKIFNVLYYYNLKFLSRSTPLLHQIGRMTFQNDPYWKFWPYTSKFQNLFAV